MGISARMCVQNMNSSEQIQWFPWNDWPFVMNNTSAMISVLLPRWKRDGTRLGRDEHNGNTKHLIAYSRDLMCSVQWFIQRRSLQWRAADTPNPSILLNKWCIVRANNNLTNNISWHLWSIRRGWCLKCSHKEVRPSLHWSPPFTE